MKMKIVPSNELMAIRNSLQFCNDSPNGGISDTLWMMDSPETIFDAFDAMLADCPEVETEPFFNDVIQAMALLEARCKELEIALADANNKLKKAKSFAYQAEMYISESSYELDGFLGTTSAEISVYWGKTIDKNTKLLATPTTDEHLQALFKEWMGEPAAWVWKSRIIRDEGKIIKRVELWNPISEHVEIDDYTVFDVTPLYAPKKVSG